MSETRRVDGVRLRFASADEIRARSSGEVTRAETFDPETGEPVVGGLFCPHIFGTPAILREYGPDGDRSACDGDNHAWTRDGAADAPSATCGRCGLRLTAVGSAEQQRERFGHIELAAPVPHPWLLQEPGFPLSLLLGCHAGDLQNVLDGTASMVVAVDERALAAAVDKVRRAHEALVAALRQANETRIEALRQEAENAELRILDLERQVKTAEGDCHATAYPQVRGHMATEDHIYQVRSQLDALQGQRVDAPIFFRPFFIGALEVGDDNDPLVIWKREPVLVVDAGEVVGKEHQDRLAAAKQAYDHRAVMQLEANHWDVKTEYGRILRDFGEKIDAERDRLREQVLAVADRLTPEIRREHRELDLERAQQPTRVEDLIESLRYAIDDEEQAHRAIRYEDLPEAVDLREALDRLLAIEPGAVLGQSQREAVETWAPGACTYGSGVRAVQSVLSALDLDALIDGRTDTDGRVHPGLRQLAGRERRRTGGVHLSKLGRRLKLAADLRRAGIKPAWMLLRTVPVVPAALRPEREQAADAPMFTPNDDASDADLNESYCEVIVNNEWCWQQAVNGAPEPERLKAERDLAEAVRKLFGMLDDRIVDEDGDLHAEVQRHVQDEPGGIDEAHVAAVPDPTLGLDQCGLPRRLALPLFAPLVAVRLVESRAAADLGAAARAIQHESPAALAALDEVADGRMVTLARDPVRVPQNVLAFETALIDENAVRLHPVAALMLGIDDQASRVLVRAPLSPLVQREARALMRPSSNLLDLVGGGLAFSPTADIALGCYWLTLMVTDAKGEGRRFGSCADAIQEYELRTSLGDDGIDLQARILVRMRRDPDGHLGEYDPTADRIDTWGVARPDDLEMVPTTVGRLLLFKTINDALRNHGAAPMPIENKSIGLLELKTIMTALVRDHTRGQAVDALGALTTVALRFATASGVSIGMRDITVPPSRPDILAEADAMIDKVNRLFHRRLIEWEDARHRKIISTWNQAKDTMYSAVAAVLAPSGPLTLMAQSGARGNIQHIGQIMGMLGLREHPWGFIQETPIRSNWGHGLTPHEYAMHAQSARSGAVKNTLREREADRLRRSMVASLGDVAIAEEDCGTLEGVSIENMTDPYRQDRLDTLVGRYLTEPAADPTTGVVVVAMDPDDAPLTEAEVQSIAKAGLSRVTVRSPVTCESRHGVCRRCYGWDMSQRTPVAVGTPVGLRAALALAADAATMRPFYFHSGWVPLRLPPSSSEPPRPKAEPAAGLARLVELLEARRPVGAAILSEIDGTAFVRSYEDGRRVTVIGCDRYELPSGYRWLVAVGDSVEIGQPLAETAWGWRLVARRSGRIFDADKALVWLRPEAPNVTERHEHWVPGATWIRVQHGEQVEAGYRLAGGEPSPPDVLRIQGRQAAQQYLLRELRDLYRACGLTVDERYLEVAVRQMFRSLRVSSPGDSGWAPGELVDRAVFEVENRRILENGHEPATAAPVVLGLSALPREADGFLAAATFGSARRALRRAAAHGVTDHLMHPTARIMVGNLATASLH